MFGDDGATKQITDHDEISDVIAAGGSLVWVDVLDATEDDLTKIEDEFSLHPLAMEDVRHPGQRPKIERYDTHAYLVAYASNGDPNQLSELDCFVADGWMVTIRHSFQGDACMNIDEVCQRFDRTRSEHNTVGFLLYTLLDTVVDTYFDALDKTEDELEVDRGTHLLRRHARGARPSGAVAGTAPRAAHLPPPGGPVARRAPGDPPPRGTSDP